MTRLSLKPIGTIHSPFRQAAGTPIQSTLANGAEGWAEIFPQFVPGLKDVAGFERIWLLYWFDRATPPHLSVKPFLDQQTRGIFATRAPCRPNPIGLSCVRLLRIEGYRLRIADFDILDETPLLDIKPYAPTLDSFKVRRVGWLQNRGDRAVVADDRFERKGVACSPKRA
jgi:tRNA (adenine37-N6)-methyltransferase